MACKRRTYPENTYTIADKETLVKIEHFRGQGYSITMAVGQGSARAAPRPGPLAGEVSGKGADPRRGGVAGREAVQRGEPILYGVPST